MSDRVVPKVGMKVFVFSPDKKFLGEGEIVKVEPLILEETGEVLTETYPTIRLKDGREFGGLECWWMPKPCDEVTCGECLFRSRCSEAKPMLDDLIAEISNFYNNTENVELKKAALRVLYAAKNCEPEKRDIIKKAVEMLKSGRSKEEILKFLLDNRVFSLPEMDLEYNNERFLEC